MKTGLRASLGAVLLIAWSSLLGCRTQLDTAWDEFGTYKRDTLRQQVVLTHDALQRAKDHFKGTYNELQMLAQSESREINHAFRVWQKLTEPCSQTADLTRNQIQLLDSFTREYFVDWERETSQITTASLKASSDAKLKEVQSRYAILSQQLEHVDQGLKTVMDQLRDQGIELKHHLDAPPPAAVPDAVKPVQVEIGRLLGNLNGAQAQIQEFLETLPKPPVSFEFRPVSRFQGRARDGFSNSASLSDTLSRYSVMVSLNWASAGMGM
jgi:hypothetical protein